MVWVYLDGEYVIIELQYRGHIQQMVYEEFEARVREGEIPPEVPIRFDAVTGDQFVPAGKLELYRELFNPQRRAFRDKLIKPGMPIITAILVGLQIRVYLLSWAPKIESWFQSDWTNWAPGVLEQGELYRLLTYGLLHTSFTHLLFNLTFLAYTGYNLERALGGINLLLLYFGSVFSGGLLSMWMAPERPSLGASGGDFGLIAAAVVFGWKHWEDIPTTARTKFGWALAPYLGFSLISGLSSTNVDNWGHLGGLLGGALMMTMLSPEFSAHNKLINRRIRWGLIGISCAVCLLLFRWGPNLIRLQDQNQGSWSVPVPEYWREGWTFTGDRGWFSPTGTATMVVNRTIHDRPISNEQAVESLIERIGSSGTTPDIVEKSDIRIGNHDGVALRIQIDLSGTPTELHAVVVTRGVMTYRTHLQAESQQIARYQPIFERAVRAAKLTLPDTLVDAEKRALNHPRSWQPAVTLGDELFRVGRPIEAVAAYQRALTKKPNQTRAWIGLLRTHTFYPIPSGLDVARRALTQPDPDARVIVAAADLLDSVDSNQEAKQALDNAWRALPGNGIVRRARIQRGMPVDP